MLASKPERTIIALILSGALLVGAGTAGWLRPVAGVAGAVFSPIGRLLSSSGGAVGQFFTEMGQVRNLASQNQQLEQQVADLKQQLSADEEIRQQDEALRKQLNFTQSQPYQLIPAQVTGYQPDDFRQFLAIGRGSADGVKIGQAVISEGSLVGIVSDVSAHSAKIFLVSDPAFKIDGMDQASRATGTVTGQLGNGLAMDKIAQSDVVKPGDTIITSGLGGNVPKGLIIGQVESINQSDNAVFQTAQLVSSVRTDHLEMVFVVKNQ